jgi:shikimate dehydrogenase
VPLSGEAGPPARRVGSIRRLGVLGWPVRHSRSPAMQRAAIAAAGLSDHSYQLLPVPPELFDETVRALGAAGFAGANVTLPHKAAALALADEATPAARAIGAANTLTFAPGGAIAAANTDAPGLIEALGVDPAGRSAIVLGAGGTARAAVWALREAGADVAIWARDPERARILADAMGVAAIVRPAGADLLVNATTVGMDGRTSRSDALRSLALDSDQLRDYAHVIDFVYTSAPTPLVGAARERGVPAVDGLAILVAQGALSFELWTGRVAARDEMERAARG